MIDTYQNQSLPHIVHVKMLFRALFSKKLWKAFLKESGYPEACYYISREADNIIDIFVNGYMALLYIFWDHLKRNFPLALWMKGSEPNEHIFGFLHVMVSDFTMLNVLHLMPKIRVQLMAACWKNGIKADFQKTAGSYSHFYFDSDDINLPNLLNLPSDEEISVSINSAYEEACILWQLLGFFPNLESKINTPQANAELDKGNDDLDNEDEDAEDNEGVDSGRQELDEALKAANGLYKEGIQLTATENALQESSYAAAALNLADLERL
jgi:hypothetical protein